MEIIQQPISKISNISIAQHRAKGPSWGMLASIFFAFLVGIVSTFILIKITTGASETFTTTGLIGFLFSIALASASIVLAISAIALGKLSEKAMIERSDESIRLQNDVFLKTTDALQRIESSTGVTEKRIEDIISGRAGAISESIADKLSSESGLRGISRRQLELEIRQSVLSELSESKIKERAVQEAEKKKNRQESRKQYENFKDAILLSIANHPNTTSIKIGEGYFGLKGCDLVDGAYKTPNGEKLAVCTFCTDDILADEFLGDKGERFSNFLRTLSKEIVNNTFTRVFLVFDNELIPESLFTQAFNELKILVKTDVIDKYELFSGPINMVKEDIIKRLDTMNLGNAQP